MGKAKKSKKAKAGAAAAAAGGGLPAAAGGGVHQGGGGGGHQGGGGNVDNAPPNQILFLTNLPEETNEMMLSMLFNQVGIWSKSHILISLFPVPWIQGGQTGPWKARHCICGV